MGRFKFAAIVVLSLLAAASDAYGASEYMVCRDSCGPNSWIAWRRDVTVDKSSAGDFTMRISCDSKYWLWVNGKLAVFEGCLKRGPERNGSYYDEIDLSRYLRHGTNRIAILQWYFGKSGFSHNDSGRPVMWIDAPWMDDGRWVCRLHPAFGDTDSPKPNYRLPESNVRFDERLNIRGWQNVEPAFFSEPERLYGEPLGVMVPRPVPMWRDFGVKPLKWKCLPGAEQDTLVADLPYNMQMTPVVRLRDRTGGTTVKIETDHAYHGKAHNIRAEYVTAKGVHTYESPGWMNGEKLLVIIPHSGARLLYMGYRETGYDMSFEGSFNCSDPFFNRFWQKALRSLYVNMRDNFFDCPDRERAQWWGDVVTMQGECFYSCSLSAIDLIRKAILQLCAFRREDGTLYSPIPGNYRHELPAQMLSAVGKYGFWTYYLNTGDRATLETAYPCVKSYLALWSLDETGLTAFRKGGWSWGDWGTDKDMRLILAAWHYMALDGAALMASELGFDDDAALYREAMAKVREGYNLCWTGRSYRHPSYTGATDDRVQALAVVAGIAPSEWWPEIVRTLREEEHASPYLEKYVMEALFKMGEGEYALERERRRFSQMVDDTLHTTLYEGWKTEDALYGGGTTNHAWSGGTLTVIAQELCGVRPLEPGWKSLEIKPRPAGLSSYSISFPTVAGTVSTSWNGDRLDITTPVRALVANPWTGEENWFEAGSWTVANPAR